MFYHRRVRCIRLCRGCPLSSAVSYSSPMDEVAVSATGQTRRGEAT